MRFEVSNTANQALQSEINRSIIFNHIRENSPVSRMEITRTLHISASAVSRVINSLIKEKYVIEAEKIETPVGKRPTLLRINGEKGSVLAVDLSQDRLRMALYDFAGRLLCKHEGSRIQGKRESLRALMEEVRFFLDGYLQDKQQSIESLGLSAISVGVPADVDSESGRILSASLYEEWYEVNLKEMFEREFKLPTLLAKDVTLSVWAEKRVGAGRDNKNIAFVEISNGVSAGIVCDDRLIRGSSGSAGQIAFSVINKESECFQDRNLGYLDKYASVKSLKEQMSAELCKGRVSEVCGLPGFNQTDPDPALICEAALRGDKLSKKVIAGIVKLLSSSLTNLVLVVNPEVLILGGHISNLPGVEELFAEELTRNIERAIPFKVPEIRISSLGQDVVLVGASLWAIEAVIAGEFPYHLGTNIGV